MVTQIGILHKDIAGGGEGREARREHLVPGTELIFCRCDLSLSQVLRFLLTSRRVSEIQRVVKGLAPGKDGHEFVWLPPACTLIAWGRALWAHFIYVPLSVLTTWPIFLSHVMQVVDMLGEFRAGLQWDTKNKIPSL